MNFDESEQVSFEGLLGKILQSVVQVGADQLIFTFADGRKFRQFHNQECCEKVTIDSIDGDLSDLVGEVLLAAESMSTNKAIKRSNNITWTFYRIGTLKGTCVIRWYGRSNGYYSERVNFEEVD